MLGTFISAPARCRQAPIVATVNRQTSSRATMHQGVSQDCTWVFGRGASIANGLSWLVPQEWRDDLLEGRVTRDDHVRMIKDTVREEMTRVPRRVTPYRRLLDVMATKTVARRGHNLLTTNWDYLLQRDVLDWVEDNTPGFAPRFLDTHSTVYHLNGSVETGDNSNRSPFVLETDQANVRKTTFEANQAFNILLWSELVVIVGMSFECDMDRGLLGALRAHEDNMPIGKALFIIVDPNEETLRSTCAKLASCFPRAGGVRVSRGLKEWIESGMRELMPRVFTA